MIEVWSVDVVASTQSFAASRSAGFYSVTGISVPAPLLPAKYALKQNYPNPFNPSTSISYEISGSGLVTLKVYNILGGEVAALVNGNMQPGVYTVKFDGSALSSGVYLYRLQAGSFFQTHAMLLLK